MKFFCVFALVVGLSTIAESLICRFCNEEYIYSWAGNDDARPDGKEVTKRQSPGFVSCDAEIYETCNSSDDDCFNHLTYYATSKQMSEDVSFNLM